MAYDPNNIFARILRGELPKIAVYEDDLTLAFMDVAPATPGHTLVIPKEPAVTLFDCSPDGAAATIRTTQKVAAAVKRAFGVPGIMLVQLNDKAAGQSVPHLHFHILPRDSGLDMTFHGRKMVDPASLVPIAERIKLELL
ncbi:MAG TPA: HIT family protein [Rhizomicrobium sp.]|nr:HIT family protein [Rhizomicrobium sp.]